MIEDMFRAVAMRRPIWRAPLALLVLGGALFFALSSGPAEAATTFSVISTGDEEDANLANATCDVDVSQTGSQCTLRAAIQEANDTAGADTIAFDIGATGAQTINVGSTGLGGLPAITDTITIDGYSQPGARPNNLAEGNDARLNVLLDGLNAGSGVDGLRIEAADSTIKGLLIRRFDQDGIQITGAGATGNRIEGNFIGVNRDGITDRGNGRVGIEIDSASNTVGGVEPEMRNVISGNGVYGVHIFGAGAIENRVEGNYVGTTADGTQPLGNDQHGVAILGSENTIGGTTAGARNVISGNGIYGVKIDDLLGVASENRVEGNYIGTTASGSGALGNDYGVRIEGDSNTVGGTLAGARNVISGNDGGGVVVSEASENRVEGNYIGTTANGTQPLGNDYGVNIEGDSNTVGGTATRARNVISGNELEGVQISASSTGNEVQGNYIGTSADGSADLGNRGRGVVIENAVDNTIGGTLAGARNVVSGNDLEGVVVSGLLATGNKVQGNYVGTTADGTQALGNTGNGVLVSGESNTIGGTTEEARNVISGNEENGIKIDGVLATENRVEGNYIGTTASGSGALGNAGSGVLIDNGANLTAVGGRTPPGAGNRIAHNGLAGVTIASSNSTSTVGNHILSNSIFANDGLGIDLRGGTEGANGVTANDTNDADTGPNSLQNFPVIRSATKNPASPTTTISGRLNSDSSQDFVIQCFLTNGAPASAHGEGSRLLKTVLVSTNASGNASFSCVSSLPILGQVPGQTVSATATNIVTGDSSEFSKNRAITVGP